MKCRSLSKNYLIFLVVFVLFFIALYENDTFALSPLSPLSNFDTVYPISIAFNYCMSIACPRFPPYVLKGTNIK